MSREWIIDDDFLDEETKLSADGQGYLKKLVRCKDCKYYCAIYPDRLSECEKGFETYGNDFCSYGEGEE